MSFGQVSFDRVMSFVLMVTISAFGLQGWGPLGTSQVHDGIVLQAVVSGALGVVSCVE
jgi:hypothetical protein